MSERWKIIQGYINYAVSDCGRIQNLKTGKYLKHQKATRGGEYPFINLFKNGVRKNKTVHSLVAEAFIGNRPDGHVVHHKDTNRSNCHFSNYQEKQ